MKVNESLWEALKNTIEMHTEQDPNITDVLINYQVKESNGVKNIIKLNLYYVCYYIYVLLSSFDLN